MEPRDDLQGQDRLDQDRLDQWLDSALLEYGSAVPRVGLESRLLANLAAEKARVGVRRRWWVLGAAAAIACAAMAMWLGGINHSKSVDKIAGKTTSPLQKTDTAKEQSEAKRPSLEAAVELRPRPRSAKTVAAAEEPRLSQFPSPRPLSEQEQLLERYVRESPGEAIMIARAQAEQQKELEKLAADGSSRGDSDQQKR